MKKILFLLLLAGIHCDTAYTKSGAGFGATGAPSSQSVTFSGLATVTEITTLPLATTTGTNYILKTTQSAVTADAIVIGTNDHDIVIDLGGNTLLGNGSVDTAIDGITIANNVENIVIKNGSIRNFSGDGITVGANCKNIHLENLHITDCMRNSINFLGNASDTPIIGCTIKNCIISDGDGSFGTGLDGAPVGINLAFCEGIIVEDTHIVAMKASETTENSYGCLITSCTDVKMKNVLSGIHAGADVHGFSVVSSVGVRFDGCEATGCYSFKTTGTGAAGFIFNTSKSCIMNDCLSSGHEGLHESYGVYINACTGIIMNHCAAIGNTVSLSSAANSKCAGFFSAGGVGNVWRDCVSSGNKGAAVATSIVSGFELTKGEYQSSLINCIAEGNGDTLVEAKAYGFFLNDYALARDISSCQINNCQAIGNCSVTASGAIGFYDNRATTKNMFVDNFAYGNNANGTTDNYNVTPATGSFNEIEADIGGILDLANKPNYFNVSITSD